MNRQTYSKEELFKLSDNELLNILAESCGLKNKKIEAWGVLPPLKGNTFGFLKDVRLIETDKELQYPFENEEHVSTKAFVSPPDAMKLGKNNEASFLRVELELSPKAEREKHNNPLSLCVKQGSAELLRELPINIDNDILNLERNDQESTQLIASSIYDFYYNKAHAELNELMQKKRQELEKQIHNELQTETANLESLRSEVTEEEKKKNSAIEVGKALFKRQAELNESISTLIEEQAETKNLIDLQKKHLLQIETEMNKKIEKLKNYVNDKALFLTTFELVDEDELDIFLSKSLSITKKIEGVSFSDEFQGDYHKAVSYIQSFLYNKDILYPRHIIENFITLLRTKDLIVLAGDSGSGKTNLVKSFARAVGGKSVIIPVKPNWTSSEDLLGYYNPLEKKYLATPFLEALLEAQRNPETPYFICLDEMNLSRVEYYFADFLSLLESRDEEPEITLYSADESSHVLSELKAVVDIIQSTKKKYNKDGVTSFIELLKDEELNAQLRTAFGFGEQDSLIKYHNEIRRMLAAAMELPATIKMPANVHIIGAINIDETTHYLSPKILDRAHIMRFESPLLTDWDAIANEIESYDFDDVSKPLLFEIEALGYREEYPKFDRNAPFCRLFIDFNKEFFHPMGVEFGMRTIRQGLNYLKYFSEVNSDQEKALNNFLLHKVLPKLTFDGNKNVGEQTKLELIDRIFTERIKQQLPEHKQYDPVFSTVHALENLVDNAKANDGIINFWAK